MQGWKQAEVTKYLTFSPFLYNNLFYITMNQNKWSSLDPKDQKAIEAVNEKFFEEVAMGLWDKQNESALKYAVDEKGMEVITLSQEEQDQWISLIEPIQDDYVAQMNEKGQQGQEILAKVKNLADQYNKEYE